jgi:hypothetical protein
MNECEFAGVLSLVVFEHQGKQERSNFFAFAPCWGLTNLSSSTSTCCLSAQIYLTQYPSDNLTASFCLASAVLLGSRHPARG